MEKQELIEKIEAIANEAPEAQTRLNALNLLLNMKHGEESIKATLAQKEMSDKSYEAYSEILRMLMSIRGD